MNEGSGLQDRYTEEDQRMTSTFDHDAVDLGEGQPLILMHGSVMDRTMFEAQYSLLSDTFRVLAFDFRARTDRALAPYDLYDLADDCCAVLDDRGIGRCVVGGMSMGALVALRVALQHPDRVEGLVLIGGQASAFSPSDQNQWAAHYGQGRGETLGLDMAEGEIEANFHPTTADRMPELVDHWRRRMAECSGDAVYLEVMSWLRSDDVRDRLSEISVPTLIVHGDGDPSIPVESAVEMYRLLPNAELLVLPRTGHAANLERPDEVNSAIRDFMKRVKGPQ